MVGYRTGLSVATVESAKLMLAEATRIDVVKYIRDKAEALRQYAKQAGDSLGSAEPRRPDSVACRAACRWNWFRSWSASRGRYSYCNFIPRWNELRECWTETHIAPTTAHRWQKIAEVPEDTLRGTSASCATKWRTDHGSVPSAWPRTNRGQPWSRDGLYSGPLPLQ